jgi:NTE family protein
MERLGRVNETLEHVPAAMQEQLQLRKIDTVWIRPSRDIAELAEKLFHRLPRVIRYLMSGLGSAAEAAELSSYLLFDPQFCGALVDMGYRDAMAQETELRRFLAERG